MTAYGYASLKEGDIEIALSLSGLNRKSLELMVDVPKPLQGFEREALLFIKSKVKRGKIQLRGHLQETKPSPGFTLPLSSLQTCLEGLKSLAESQQIPYTPSLDTLATLLHCLPNAANANTVSESMIALYQTCFFKALEQAFEAFEDSRQKEGLALKTDILLHLLALEKASQDVKALSPETINHYRLKLLDRLKQSGLELDLQDERVLKEIALFADRSDITEELTRLESHYLQFRSALEDVDSGSRKIDFLCQEIQREWNTIGSKANSLSITQHMLGAKLNLEKIKEQLQNLE